MFTMKDFNIAIIFIVTLFTVTELAVRESPCYVNSNHPQDCNSDNIKQ